MRESHRVAPPDHSAWTMDCVLEEVWFLELHVPTNHGHPQSVQTIAPMVSVTSSLTDWTMLTT